MRVIEDNTTREWLQAAHDRELLRMLGEHEQQARSDKPVDEDALRQLSGSRARPATRWTRRRARAPASPRQPCRRCGRGEVVQLWPVSPRQPGRQPGPGEALQPRAASAPGAGRW